jgi:hypothetical protein
VLIPYHGYLAAGLGKPAFAHAMASDDVWRSGTPPAVRWMAAQEQALAAQHFDAVILDSHPGMVTFGARLAEAYQPTETLFDDRDDVFWPIRGMRTRPARLYEPVRP